MGRAKTREEKLFAAAVLRRSFELKGQAEAEAFRMVYEGVLRDLGLADEEVRTFLRTHGEQVESAIQRRGG